MALLVVGAHELGLAEDVALHRGFDLSACGAGGQGQHDIEGEEFE